jgi:hypothetical protein
MIIKRAEAAVKAAQVSQVIGMISCLLLQGSIHRKIDQSSGRNILNHHARAWLERDNTLKLLDYYPVG